MSTTEEPAVGRTRWRRFAAIMIPAGVGVGALLFATAAGAVPVSFKIAGQSASITADKIEGTGFVQYGSTVDPAGGSTTPVAVSGMKSADITNMCQSVKIGPVTLRLTAGDKGTPAHAENLVLSLSSLDADSAKFTDMQIGRDAATLDGNSQGASGMFGQQAGTVVLTKAKQTSWATTAGSFTLPNLHLGFTGGSCD